jgi:hypothetical protein
MFSGQLSLLKFVNYRFGNPTCNLEHRRVNIYIPNMLGITESRRLRVERKALVFLPNPQRTTLAVFKELFPQRHSQLAL